MSLYKLKRRLKKKTIRPNWVNILNVTDQEQKSYEFQGAYCRGFNEKKGLSTTCKRVVEPALLVHFNPRAE